MKSYFSELLFSWGLLAVWFLFLASAAEGMMIMSDKDNEAGFWALIEAAWNDILKDAPGSLIEIRESLSGQVKQRELQRLLAALNRVVPCIERRLRHLNRSDLLAFDRMLERKLHDLDTFTIHTVLDGSDDGFLYGRGFVIAIGKKYYERVLSDVVNYGILGAGNAIAECERMTYLSWHLYEERFGNLPASGISRESGANEIGWPGGGEGGRPAQKKTI